MNSKFWKEVTTAWIKQLTATLGQINSIDSFNQTKNNKFRKSEVWNLESTKSELLYILAASLFITYQEVWAMANDSVRSGVNYM